MKMFKKMFIVILSIILILLLAAGCAEQAEPAFNEDDDGQETETEVKNENADTPLLPDSEAETHETDKNNTNADANENENAVYEDGFVFVYNGTSVYLGEYIDRILEELGASADCFESDSCTSDGVMTTYSYGGFEISTYVKEPNSGKESIFWISFNDDSVSTSEGIYIGQTVSDMIAVYGEAQEEFTGSYYRYIKNGTALSFDVDGDIITAVTYQLLVI